MHGLEIKTLSIEVMAALRDDVIALLAEKVAAKQAELEAEVARVQGLNAGKPSAAPKPKAAMKYRSADGSE